MLKLFVVPALVIITRVAPTQSPAGIAATTSLSSIVSEARSYGLDRIDQRGFPLDNKFRRSGTGRGVTVYLFESGVSEAHPELKGHVRMGFDFFPEEDDADCKMHHGTGVASAIAGKSVGVAPEALIVVVKVFSCASDSPKILEGVEWVIKDHQARGAPPAVVNWSFSADSSGGKKTYYSAVRALTEAGMLVVVAASNWKMDACRIASARVPESLTVGGTALEDSGQTHDNLAPRSSWGSCVALYAPGDNVLLAHVDTVSLAQDYSHWYGTSMATGYVSGAAALYLESNPYATPAEVKTYLLDRATKVVLPSLAPDTVRLLYVGP